MDAKLSNLSKNDKFRVVQEINVPPKKMTQNNYLQNITLIAMYRTFESSNRWEVEKAAQQAMTAILQAMGP